MRFRLVHGILAALIIAVTLISLQGKPYAQSEQGIVALVNDEPISAYDVDQRMRLKLLGSKQVTNLLKKKVKDPSTPKRFREMAIKARPKTQEEVNALKEKFFKQLRREAINSLKPKLKKEVLEELIDERLMLQEAKKLNVSVGNEDIEGQLQKMASRSKDRATGKPLTTKEFLAQLTRIGVNESAFRQRLKASIAFQKVVRRKYGRFISIGDQQVDRLLASSDTSSDEKKTEYQLQKVVLKLPKDANQKAIAGRFLEADRLRARFSSCKKTRILTQSLQDTAVQTLGKRTPAQIPQPARAMLLQTETGTMTPPSFALNAIELYAVCSRKTVTADVKKRQEVKAKLRQQEIQVVQRRYMRDLRQDAFVEYRQQ